MAATVFDRPGDKVDLQAISAEPPKSMTRETAELAFAELGDELGELQDQMFGSKANSVLVVLQAATPPARTAASSTSPAISTRAA